jgi:hypothetical protein
MGNTWFFGRRPGKVGRCSVTRSAVTAVQNEHQMED